MNKKQQFLNELETSLRGNVSSEVLNETLQYYEQYIDREMRSGKSEEDVIRALGNGHMIAKSVISAKGNPKSFYKEEQSTSFSDSEADTKGSFSERAKKYLMIALVIVIIFAILSIVVRIVWLLLPIILIGILIAWLLKRL